MVAGAGVHLLSLVLPAREMFQVPLLSRKSMFILALSSRELGFGAPELGKQVQGETTTNHGGLSKTAGSNLRLASSAAFGDSLQLSGLVLLWKVPLLGAAVTVLSSTPASVSQGINELQAASLITCTALAFISPLPQGNFSWQREGKK